MNFLLVFELNEEIVGWRANTTPQLAAADSAETALRRQLFSPDSIKGNAMEPPSE